MVAVTPAQVLAHSAHFQLYGTSMAAPVRWRLLSGNNRDIGRGTLQFDSIESCLASIAHLQRSVGELRVVWRRIGHQWTWQLDDVDGTVAVAGMAYDRRIRCEQSLAQFRSCVPVAPVREQVMYSDSRRWAAARPARIVSRPIAPLERQG